MQLRSGMSLVASLLAGFAWWACSNSSSGGGGAGGTDAGGMSEEAGDGPAAEAPECNPCFEFCACTPGVTVYSPAQCMTYTCPPTGVWGAMGCTGPSMCPADAALDHVTPADASSADAPDASSSETSAPLDATPEATGDAAADSSSADSPGEAAGD